MKQLHFITGLLLWIGLCLGTFPVVQAQDTKVQWGEFQDQIGRRESDEEACTRARLYAQIDAIEMAYGTVVIQGNSTFIESETNGKRSETTQIFNTIAETMVNGEWLRTISEPECEFFDYEGKRWVKARVKGEVGKLDEPKIELSYKSLDCEDLKCETEMFREGESFYLYLRSPVSGYVTVYLTDKEIAQCLLPYNSMPTNMESGVFIEADQPYILFSRRKNQFELEDLDIVDEYEFYANTEQDHNRIFIIYSKEPLAKPNLSRVSSDYGPMPRQLSAEDFHRWLAKRWRFNKGKNMQIDRLDITITKAY